MAQIKQSKEFYNSQRNKIVQDGIIQQMFTTSLPDLNLKNKNNNNGTGNSQDIKSKLLN